MNRFYMFCAGLLLMGSLSGCCLLHGGGYGAGYGGYGGGCGPCQSGGCGVGAGGFPSAMAPGGFQSAAAPFGPQTAFMNPYGGQAIAMDPMPTIIR